MIALHVHVLLLRGVLMRVQPAATVRPSRDATVPFRGTAAGDGVVIVMAGNATPAGSDGVPTERVVTGHDDLFPVLHLVEERAPSAILHHDTDVGRIEVHTDESDDVLVTQGAQNISFL